MIAMIGAGCALAGHGLLPSTSIHWHLQGSQVQVIKELQVQRPTRAPNNYLLVVHIEPSLVLPADTNTEVERAPVKVLSHSYEVAVVCARNGGLLRRQSFSEFPVASGGKFSVQLPEAIEQCFVDAEAVLSVSIRLVNAEPDVSVNGSFYLEMD